jgi:hypothetical protein
MGSSTAPKIFHGDHMTTEYVVESASDKDIRFCTHKNMKIEDINHEPNKQPRQFYAVLRSSIQRESKTPLFVQATLI